jgi:hypothetical protein
VKYTPEISQKAEYISRNVKLTPAGGGHRGTSLLKKNKNSFIIKQIYPLKIQKAEYIKPVIPVTFQDGPLCWVHHQG